MLKHMWNSHINEIQLFLNVEVLVVDRQNVFVSGVRHVDLNK